MFEVTNPPELTTLGESEESGDDTDEFELPPTFSRRDAILSGRFGRD